MPDTTLEPKKSTNPNYVLVISFTLTALNVMDRQVLAITAGAIQTEFGLTDLELGVLTGFAFVVMHATVGIPISSLADRTNRRNVITFGLVAWSALTAVTGLVQSYAQIFAARIGVGIGEAVGSGPLQSLLADYFPIGRRGMALAVTGAGGNAGAFIALLLGGFLVDAVGWRLTFFLFGAPGIVVALLLFFTVDEPERGAADQRSVEDLPLLEGIGRFASMPSFWYLTLSATFNQFTNYGFLFFLPLAMMRLYGLDTGEVGLYLALCQAAPTFAGVLASGLLVDRLGRRDLRWHLRVPAIASTLAVPLALAFLSLDSLVPALVLCACMSFFSTMWLATGNAALQGVVHPSVRATAFAVLLFFSSLIGLGIGPTFVGWASDALSPRYGDESIRFALMAAASVQLLGGLSHYLASRRYPQDANPA